VNEQNVEKEMGHKD